MNYLEENGIGTRQLFAGNILRQPAFKNNKIKLRIKGSNIMLSDELSWEHYSLLSNTEKIMNQTFWVGIWPGLKEKDLEHMIQAMKLFIKKKK